MEDVMEELSWPMEEANSIKPKREREQNCIFQPLLYFTGDTYCLPNGNTRIATLKLYSPLIFLWIFPPTGIYLIIKNNYFIIANFKLIIWTCDLCFTDVKKFQSLLLDFLTLVPNCVVRSVGMPKEIQYWQALAPQHTFKYVQHLVGRS